jgi:hypothetical protein
MDGLKMTYSLISVLLLVSATAGAIDHDDIPINSGSELRDWCKLQSEAVFVGRGLTPFNWSASYSDEGNALQVKGKWRVNGSDVSVECRVARGAQSRYASMSIQESP